MNLKCLYFPVLFPYYGNPLSLCFGNSLDFCFTRNIYKIHKCQMFLFSHTFHVLWKSTFPMFWELYQFKFHVKYWRNTWLWNVCVFPYFPRTMEIHFPHILGIVWIPASNKIFRKSINLKCLCFPVLFRYYGNPLFPCFANLMDFCVAKKIWGTENIGMFMFSHTFLILWKSIFPIFWELGVNRNVSQEILRSF